MLPPVPRRPSFQRCHSNGEVAPLGGGWYVGDIIRGGRWAGSGRAVGGSMADGWWVVPVGGSTGWWVVVPGSAAWQQRPFSLWLFTTCNRIDLWKWNWSADLIPNQFNWANKQFIICDIVVGCNQFDLITTWNRTYIFVELIAVKLRVVGQILIWNRSNWCPLSTRQLLVINRLIVIVEHLIDNFNFSLIELITSTKFSCHIAKSMQIYFTRGQRCRLRAFHRSLVLFVCFVFFPPTTTQ